MQMGERLGEELVMAAVRAVHGVLRRQGEARADRPALLTDAGVRGTVDESVRGEFQVAAPTLTAGNVGLLKHASNVPQSALYLDMLFERAGFPVGSFQALLIGAADVEAVVRDRRVAAVTLTGSEPTGRSIAAVAAVAGSEVKKAVLELGGSDRSSCCPPPTSARRTGPP